MSAIIINCPGGNIVQHVLTGLHYLQTGASVAVIYCASACLNLIGQIPPERVCFYPQAWIGYHTAARLPDGTEPTWTMRWERGRDWIARGYPECKR